jgi:hypothetical protein
MAHEWRKQVCAIDELRLSKKSMSQGRSIDFFPMAHQRRMAHFAASKREIKKHPLAPTFLAAKARGSDR